MNWFLRLFYTITGGRPMTRLEGAFTDRVSGEPVSYYRDAFGRRWLANDDYSFFRVLASRQ